MRTHRVLGGLGGLLLAACGADQFDTSVGKNSDDIIRGKIENKRPQVVAFHSQLFGNRFELCTGTYIAPRVVLTAAHCILGSAIPGHSFVYFGEDYLGDRASLPNIPPPGQPSVWARVDSITVHPEYNPGVNYPDFAIVFLDRELPFAPLPLLRSHVPDSEQKGDIVGYGGSKALTADIRVVEGAGIKRRAQVKLLGSPTEADFHPDDPNPGILDPAIRPNLLKTDGLAPHANTCAGDSGGPLLVDPTGEGKDFLAGVGFWTGLFCEDYAIFTRIDPFLAFLDGEIARAGSRPLVPRLECIEALGGDALGAHFGYLNDNGVTVTVPYGLNNDFPADTSLRRPSAFDPGDSPFDFRVDFTSGQTLSWRLAPPAGPVTQLTADASSARCDPNDPRLPCASFCTASLDAECSDGTNRHGSCVNTCVDDTAFFADDLGCGAEWNAYLHCVAGLSSDAANWDCSFQGVIPQPASPNCEEELFAVFDCAGF